MTYNDFGLLTKDAQSHAGAVNGSTPAVEYAYADGTDNHTRPTSCTYPDGRVITYDYGTSDGMDDILSRLAVGADPRGAMKEAASRLNKARVDYLTGKRQTPPGGISEFK